MGRKFVRLLPCSHFQAGPLAPQIYPGSGFDDVADVGSAHAGGYFNEIELSVAVGSEKFGVGHAANKTEFAEDLTVELEAAASTAYYAAWVAADSPDELPVVAPLAKAVCADAAYRIAADTIQLHGGIGFTWEHEAHLYFKRATATRMSLGDSHIQRRLVAERSGLLSNR